MRIFLIIFFTSIIFSGEVELLDGSIIKGEILEVNEVSVTIKVSYSDIPIEIDKNDIRKISFLDENSNNLDENSNKNDNIFFIIIEAAYTRANADLELDYLGSYYIDGWDTYADDLSCAWCYSVNYPMVSIFAGIKIKKEIPIVGSSRLGFEVGFHEYGSRFRGRLEKNNFTPFGLNVGISLGIDSYFFEQNDNISETEVFDNFNYDNNAPGATEDFLDVRYTSSFSITKLSLRIDNPFSIAISKDYILNDRKFTPKYEVGYRGGSTQKEMFDSAVHTISLGYHF